MWFPFIFVINVSWGMMTQSWQRTSLRQGPQECCFESLTSALGDNLARISLSRIMAGRLKYNMKVWGEMPPRPRCQEYRQMGLEIDNELFLIFLTTTHSVIIIIRYLITDAYKLLWLFRQRHQTDFRSTLVVELLTVDKYMTINLMNMPTYPINIDFSGLNAPVD